MKVLVLYTGIISRRENTNLEHEEQHTEQVGQSQACLERWRIGVQVTNEQRLVVVIVHERVERAIKISVIMLR